MPKFDKLQINSDNHDKFNVYEVEKNIIEIIQIFDNYIKAFLHNDYLLEIEECLKLKESIVKFFYKLTDIYKKLSQEDDNFITSSLFNKELEENSKLHPDSKVLIDKSIKEKYNKKMILKIIKDFNELTTELKNIFYEFLNEGVSTRNALEITKAQKINEFTPEIKKLAIKYLKKEKIEEVLKIIEAYKKINELPSELKEIIDEYLQKDFSPKVAFEIAKAQEVIKDFSPEFKLLAIKYLENGITLEKALGNIEAYKKVIELPSELKKIANRYIDDLFPTAILDIIESIKSMYNDELKLIIFGLTEKKLDTFVRNNQRLRDFQKYFYKLLNLINEFNESKCTEEVINVNLKVMGIITITKLDLDIVIDEFIKKNKKNRFYKTNL